MKTVKIVFVGKASNLVNVLNSFNKSLTNAGDKATLLVDLPCGLKWML